MEQLPEESKPTLGCLDIFLLEELVVASGSEDVDYVADLRKGFPVTGSLPDGNQGTPVAGGQRVHGRPGGGGPPTTSGIAR